MLYQSTGSSTCAICAVGNLLSLYGHNCSREDVFCVVEALGRSKRSLIDHSILLTIVENLVSRRSLNWHRRAKSSFDWLQRNLGQILSTGAPALLTFHMRHAQRDWAGVHCVIVVAVDEFGMHVIDSLGCRCGCSPNATISSKESPVGWRMKGAPIIVTRGPARILEGLPCFPRNN
jgi:hypothetical protein